MIYDVYCISNIIGNRLYRGKQMRIVDLDDDAHVFCGEDGEYEKWNIDTSKTIEAKPVKPVEWHIWHIYYEDCDGWYAECPNCGAKMDAEVIEE